MNTNEIIYPIKHVLPNGIISIKLPEVQLGSRASISLGPKTEMLYAKDLLTVTESPSMGCSVMEMNNSTYYFELNHDEVNYVIEGSLTIITAGRSRTIRAGEVCFIPKGSKGSYVAEKNVRFLSVSYAEKWE